MQGMNLLFQKIDDAQVIIYKRGYFAQVDLYMKYHPDKDKYYLYVRFQTGFVRLMKSRRTSVAKVVWEEIVGVDYKVDKLGRLYLEEV